MYLLGQHAPLLNNLHDALQFPLFEAPFLQFGRAKDTESFNKVWAILCQHFEVSWDVRLGFHCLGSTDDKFHSWGLQNLKMVFLWDKIVNPLN